MREKNGTQGTTRFTYFSQDNNLTVEVLFDGSSIQSLELIDPYEYQPEITDEEIADAVQLVVPYFLSLGLSRVQTLTASRHPRLPIPKEKGSTIVESFMFRSMPAKTLSPTGDDRVGCT